LLLPQARLSGGRLDAHTQGTEFLTICAFEEEQWIGKILAGGLSVTEVDDIQRNVVSILRRISSDIRIPASSVKMFVVEREPAAERSDANPPRESRGPYIANY
jgi:hypothetical protein